MSTLTKNFSGAEIEGLVRAAQSTALNRLIKVSSKINIDTEAVEKMFIERGDFMNALDTDIKPVMILFLFHKWDYCSFSFVGCSLLFHSKYVMKYFEDFQ